MFPLNFSTSTIYNYMYKSSVCKILFIEAEVVITDIALIIYYYEIF